MRDILSLYKQNNGQSKADRRIFSHSVVYNSIFRDNKANL